MSSLAQSYFSQRIDECRRRFDAGSLGFLRWFGLRSRPSYDGLDVINELLKSHYGILNKHGQVVWGCIAQVNMKMFTPGQDDLPGVTVYSTDPYYDANPQDLFAIGRACFQFKNTEPVDADFKPLAARLTDEFDQTVRMQLPTRLTEGRVVFLAATMFHRTRLPGCVLLASLVPLVIAPHATEVNMVLQVPYWSKTLCDTWSTLQDTLEGIEITSAARRIAEAAEKPPARQEPMWDVDAIPIYVTPALAHAFDSIVQEHHFNDEPFLEIVIRHDGSKYVGLVGEYDSRIAIAFESNGVPIAIRKDQRHRLRGAIVDYKNTVFAKGIVVRLPGE